VLDGAEQVDQVRPPRPIADVERAVQALLSMASSFERWSWPLLPLVPAAVRTACFCRDFDAQWLTTTCVVFAQSHHGWFAWRQWVSIFSTSKE
jgi:hypothetical protein